MSNSYETPTITELGTVADFTRGAGSGPQFDGLLDILSGSPRTPRPGGGGGGGGGAS